MDLILANRDSQPDSLLLAKATPNFSPSSRFKEPIHFGDSDVSSRAVATADFDADGHVDWVMGHIGRQNVVYFGDGVGGVKRKVSVGTVAGRTYCLAVADLNNDGRPDVVAGNAGQSNSVLFNTRDADGFRLQTFGRQDSLTYGLCTADFTGDGFADVVVANSGQPNRIYINHSGTRSGE